MKTIDAVRGSLIAVVLGAGSACAFAQEATPPVMTDVNYAPAEDRDSVGAVLLESNMVLAQRREFGSRSTPDEVQAIGRGVIEATLAAARVRESGPDTRALGGAPEPGASRVIKPRSSPR
ncbi:MAG TPA: hypothetical protein VIE63_07635 [Ramlibacter sp.]|jgi:hypothetical protein